MWSLSPPKWPEGVLGKIDRKKALAGKALLETNCASCHSRLDWCRSPPWVQIVEYLKSIPEEAG